MLSPYFSFRNAARASVVFGVIAFAVGAAQEWQAPFDGAAGWTRPPLVSAGLALQLTNSSDELANMVRDVSHLAIRRLEWDWYFIPAYGVFFLSLALVHYTQGARYRQRLTFFTILFTVLTVAFDVLENLLLGDAIAGQRPPSLLVPALKWFFFFFVMLLSAPIYVRRVRPAFAIGAAQVFFATMGLIGCLGLYYDVASRAVISVALTLVLLTNLIGMLVLAIKPQTLLPPMPIAE